MSLESLNAMRDHGLTVAEKELIRHCREQFALPNSPTNTETRIVGILRVPGQKPVPLHSGQHGGPCGGTHRGNIPRGKGSGNNLLTLTHVEGHAAAVMYERKISRASLLIELEPCKACDPNIPRMLPHGSRLEVVSPLETTHYWSCQRP